MAKKSISVTLEESTINSLRIIADEEMRSVSNLIDYIVAQYAKSLTATSVSASKINRSAIFGRNVVVEDYQATNKALMKNVFIDDEDRKFISELRV